MLGNNARNNHRKSLKGDKGKANWFGVPRTRGTVEWLGVLATLTQQERKPSPSVSTTNLAIKGRSGRLIRLLHQSGKPPTVERPETQAKKFSWKTCQQ